MKDRSSLQDAASTAVVCKRISLLRRRQDMTVDAFRAHWAGPHADIAREVPGIARYTQNRVKEVLWVTPHDHGEYLCDGLVELEFLDAHAMQLAGETVAVKALLPEDEMRFLQGITLCRTTKGARHLWPGMHKVMLAIRWEAVGCRGLSLDAWIQATGCLEYSVETVASAFHRAQLVHEPLAPHMFATLWFDHLASARRAMAPQTSWSMSARAAMSKATAWLVDPLPIMG